ncbi:hypothetical protein FN846DRAFT_938089 [Sphaerosporella brunnea]|uniref:DUF967 domain protein n=1 Tax=Sphaerosporella brunnea TaxID=1250544 RepID=A0A5J5F3Q2_9PEZI|nr:hypothetical protein FN846DRAFT_938089 [Sphaerosporella brunnea]
MPPLAELHRQQETLIFPHFTTQDAFELGSHLRTEALLAHPRTPVAIRISLPTGQILFTTVTCSPAVPDSESWLNRKAATVLRYGCSTLYLGEKMRSKGLKGDRISEMAPVDDAQYACHGGGFPVRIRGIEGVVAVIVVSGLAQEEDHKIVVEGIEWFLEHVQKK